MTAALEEGEWSTARPGRTLPLGKDPAPILQEAGWAPGPVWTGGKSRPHRDSIPDRPVRSSITIPTELPGPQISFVKPRKTPHRLHINIQELLVQVTKHYEHHLQFLDCKLSPCSLCSMFSFG